jgi:hypothetical protein
MGQALAATIIGGALVLIGGWLSDRRKEKAENNLRHRREKALLTGVFAVRNHLITKLNEYETNGLLSLLEPLRTAQSYMNRLIEKAPGESESLMIVVIEIGLKLDTLLAAVDQARQAPLTEQTQYASKISMAVEELYHSLEQFDLVTATELTMLSEEDLRAFQMLATERH